MSAMRTCSVHQVMERLEGGTCVLVDVRELPEYADAHLPGSRLIPLGELRRRPELVGEGEVLLLCRGGRRAREAAAVLEGREGVQPIVIEGGMDAWMRAGFPTRKQKGPISLERQVRIAAGSLVLLGVLVPGLIGLSYFVGAGLVFSGVTNSCAMGLLLAKLPWNRAKPNLGCAAKA